MGGQTLAGPERGRSCPVDQGRPLHQLGGLLAGRAAGCDG
jgi:hypothetical protein